MRIKFRSVLLYLTGGGKREHVHKLCQSHCLSQELCVWSLMAMSQLHGITRYSRNPRTCKSTVTSWWLSFFACLSFVDKLIYAF